MPPLSWWAETHPPAPKASLGEGNHTHLAPSPSTWALEFYVEPWNEGLAEHLNEFYLQRVGLERYFGAVVFSQDHGVQKPDLRLFEIAARTHTH